ncbi:MAG: carboxypeptidase regulatory-like domain-containing protein [Bacteroidales bacterium]|nr:carboxypeptidase regulatory-like domain-containing protein [Bacteroidales bacterium]
MKRTLFILMLLSPLALFAQEKGFTIRGYVSNGVGIVPEVYVSIGDTSWDDLGGTRTDRNGEFTLNNIPQGTYTIRIHSGFNNLHQKLDINSDLTLDTILIEEEELESNIWYLQKTDSTPATDPYLRQYLDFRHAIDAMNLSYSWKTHSYNVDSLPDANSVLTSLRGVSIDEGWLLDVYCEGQYGGGGVKFYTRRTDEPKRPLREEFPEVDLEVMPHIQVEFTPEGVWSAYQLANAFGYLPKWWHAYYYNYCGIFALDEVRHRSPALRDSLATTPEIHPHVEMLNADSALVTAYWWNDWEGLTEETVLVERVGHSVRLTTYDNYKYSILPPPPPPDDWDEASPLPDPAYEAEINRRNNLDPRITKRILVHYNCGIEF